MPRLLLDEFLPYRLSVADHVVSQVIERAYARHELSAPQWRVIAVLGEADALSQREIVDRTRMDKLTISRAARALAMRRVVLRRDDVSDGRTLRLSLSSQGRRIYDAVIPAALEVEQRIADQLGAGDRKALDKLLRKVEAAALACEDGIK
ncbi:MAG: MarR family transcriptional regulator [Polyangia bacterium]